ncbi:succinate dehydrogenase, hydrophobic membrane anchor protein [Novilysobacter selenitireducens]|uniref:Succinate dehydrogenase hydrophobic membrane anchor subunit n=1 Tax=Novilysobacter selenitireducens TaxID=2872639 RepID=A0ABS7T5X5_9GAMM|nr:succinate dehydrogenase, hydrophobic membrane anchor protein [Lysobacter selenitireducens]MBZ4039248.1 succinate dehydrogenase, hydrophobic membrane anchor protein [Lysobacter selenitireducens]
MSLRHPLKTARGLGSAKDGTHHWILQRITAIALVFLSLYVVGFVAWLAGSGYGAVREAVAHPANALLLIAFLVAAFWHAKLGMQVIIEDYVHTPWLAATAQLTVIFVCVLAAIASVLAVIRIALGA